MDTDVLENLGTNPTQLLGLLTFAGTAVACIFAKKSDRNEGRAWFTLAIINAIFLVEIIFGFRHHLHADVVSILLRADLYDNRAELQYGLIAGSAAIPIFAAACLLFFRQLRKPRLIVATLASFSVLTLFAVEAISLHRIDEIFYQEIGPVLLVGWLWFVACVATTVSTRL